ncbi:MAG: 1-(5-phosphoribosyl)-5-[(5-phosphoribosylamino)methylideneamino]imidazole-4-carboxamide isomerase [Phycisphaerae bacterium]|nr:1-(5-phosphoribosyl)-5-[(5-phosphoribosylamino)methylideneamino]imidazole-4-carboxamide isomerase [Phycisphaerae bacterium]
MELLPAIDLRDGKVVRLAQGDYDRQTTYADDPADMARRFADTGARWVHVVDLDAARDGQLANTAAVSAIRDAVDLHIEFGGGIRDRSAIETYRDLGVDRLVVGSAAMKQWDWFQELLDDATLPGSLLALGLDARGGRLCAEGWTEPLELGPVELARRVAGSDLGAIVYTDIARDGMLTGVNVDATADVIAATDVSVIASGGVRRIDDIRRCRDAGCAGVVVGRAYYEGTLDLREALAAAGESGAA